MVAFRKSLHDNIMMAINYTNTVTVNWRDWKVAILTWYFTMQSRDLFVLLRTGRELMLAA